LLIAVSSFGESLRLVNITLMAEAYFKLFPVVVSEVNCLLRLLREKSTTDFSRQRLEKSVVKILFQ